MIVFGDAERERGTGERETLIALEENEEEEDTKRGSKRKRNGRISMRK